VLLKSLNEIYPLRLTRFLKRADYYSLAYFFHSNRDVPIEDLKIAYKVYVEISDGIAPSNNRCSILKSYAYHCTTQSNSLTARQARHDILTDILANTGEITTIGQQEIISYFNLSDEDCQKGKQWLNISPRKLAANPPSDHLYGVSESINLF
jgi:hypothetical protein